MKPTIKPTQPVEQDLIRFAEAKQTTRSFTAPPGYKRLTINLPEDLHRKLKVKAAEEGVTVTQIIYAHLDSILK